MFAGVESHSWAGFPLFVLAMVLVGLAWWVASPFTIRHARLVQRIGQFMVGWVKGLSEWWEPNAQLTEQDISPHFWPNGTMPDSAEFEALVADEFAHYRLRVSGLVETPRDFSFADLKALPKQEQNHHPFLHPGMVRRRQVGRRSDARYPRHREADTGRALRRCFTRSPRVPRAAAITTFTSFTICGTG